MKSGNLIAIEAVKMLMKKGDLPDLKITILITSDEEIGSPSTRSLIESESLRSKYVLVPEPGLPDGGYVSGRYAIARFNLKAEGVPFHAGINPKAGKSRSFISILTASIAMRFPLFISKIPGPKHLSPSILKGSFLNVPTG